VSATGDLIVTLLNLIDKTRKRIELELDIICDLHSDSGHDDPDGECQEYHQHWPCQTVTVAQNARVELDGDKFMLNVRLELVDE
jgi:hypothetical protein